MDPKGEMEHEQNYLLFCRLHQGVDPQLRAGAGGRVPGEGHPVLSP